MPFVQVVGEVEKELTNGTKLKLPIFNVIHKSEPVRESYYWALNSYGEVEWDTMLKFRAICISRFNQSIERSFLYMGGEFTGFSGEPQDALVEYGPVITFLERIVGKTLINRK